MAEELNRFLVKPIRCSRTLFLVTFFSLKVALVVALVASMTTWMLLLTIDVHQLHTPMASYLTAKWFLLTILLILLLLGIGLIATVLSHWPTLMAAITVIGFILITLFSIGKFSANDQHLVTIIIAFFILCVLSTSFAALLFFFDPNSGQIRIFSNFAGKIPEKDKEAREGLIAKVLTQVTY